MDDPKGDDGDSNEKGNHQAQAFDEIKTHGSKSLLFLKPLRRGDS
jgi:hypothetical protein